MRKIQIFDFNATNDEEALNSIANDVIRSKNYILGSCVQHFEDKFARYIGTNHCIGVANGTDAIKLSLRALGVNENTKVGTVSNAGFYTTCAILEIGAIPVFLDINSKDLLLDVKKLSNKLIDSKIEVLVVTHLYGQMVDMQEVLRLAKINNFKILEDCAQSHGAEINGKKAGSFGDIATFSFYPTKNLGALGDGGAITTNDNQLYDKVMKLRQYGWTDKYTVSEKFGINSRLDEIQAAFLSYKLDNLDNLNQMRRDIAEKYIKGLQNLPIEISSDYLKSVCHLFVIRIKNRDDLKNYLNDNHIQTAIHYPIPDHLQPVIRNKYGNQENLKTTIDESKKILTLPLYPGMPNNDVDQVIATIREYYKI